MRTMSAPLLHVVCLLGFVGAATCSEMVLKVTSSGKAVLDSNMTFSAQLMHKDGSIADKSLYVYEWNDNITRTTNTTDHTFSRLNRVYYSEEVGNGTGTHNMHVTVFKKTPKRSDATGIPVASGRTPFLLTDDLNIVLTLKQNLSVPSRGVYASGIPISIFANITDHIKLINTTFEWKRGKSTFPIVTTEPHIKLTFPGSPDFQSVAVTARANCSIPDPTGKTTVQKSGHVLQEEIHIKDPLSNVAYTDNQTCSEGELLTVNVSCDGSAPFYFCSSVGTSRLPPAKCTQFNTSQDCQLLLSKNMTKAGKFFVSVVIRNDVSQESLDIEVDVKRTTAVASPLVTVACVIIGVVVFGLIGYTYRKQRRKEGRKTETADFDFYCFNVPPESSGWSLEAVRHTVTLWLSRLRGDNSSASSANRRRHVRYGAVSDNDFL